MSVIDMSSAVATIERWIAERRRTYVCVTGAHGVIESRSDPELSAIHDAAGMVTPDGMPLVWFARLSGYRGIRRVYGPDLMRELTAISPARGYRHFYYGGGPGIAEKLRETLLRRHPGLQVTGTATPPFRPLTAEEDEAMVERINSSRPDILWVGLSTPKQERWMAAHLGRIEAPVMIGVGAAFDFLSGTKLQAPAWMQRSGLEWMFRVSSEPRRLWRRYVHVVPAFLGLAAAHFLSAGLQKRSRWPRPS